MGKTLQKLSKTVASIFLSLLFLFGESHAAISNAEITTKPNETEIYAGADPITLTVRAEGSNLTYTWDIDGPGTIEGAGATVSYIIPEKIEQESLQTKITVTITDRIGEKTTETFILTILQKPSQNPKANAQRSNNLTAKMALEGLATTAFIAGGISLLTADEENTHDEPFTGTFQREYTGQTDRGNSTYNIDTYTLKQSGPWIDGTAIFSSSLPNCCTASYSVPVTGKVTIWYSTQKEEVSLRWEAGEGSCTCGNLIFILRRSAGTAIAILVENDSILRFKAGSPSPFFGGDFIRQ